jgi:hypothetical protein
MSNVGTLTVIQDNGSSSTTFEFININFPEGWPETTLSRIGEPVNSMGVDGTRARVTRNDYAKFSMVTISEAFTFDNAIAILADMRSARLKRCTLTVIADGVTYAFTGYAYIWGVEGKPVRASVVTTVGSLANPQGLVYTTWSLQFIAGT